MSLLNNGLLNRIKVELRNNNEISFSGAIAAGESAFLTLENISGSFNFAIEDCPGDLDVFYRESAGETSGYQLNEWTSFVTVAENASAYKTLDNMKTSHVAFQFENTGLASMDLSTLDTLTLNTMQNTIPSASLMGNEIISTGANGTAIANGATLTPFETTKAMVIEHLDFYVSDLDIVFRLYLRNAAGTYVSVPIVTGIIRQAATANFVAEGKSTLYKILYLSSTDANLSLALTPLVCPYGAKFEFTNNTGGSVTVTAVVVAREF